MIPSLRSRSLVLDSEAIVQEAAAIAYDGGHKSCKYLKLERRRKMLEQAAEKSLEFPLPFKGRAGWGWVS